MSDEASARAVRVLKPTGGWRAVDLKELWAYRELFVVLAGRDLKVRYKQTLLGAGWAVLQPVLTMIVFSVIFGRLANMPSDDLPYPVFVYAGLLPWQLFATTLTASTTSLLGAQQLISKVYFPRLIVPLASIGVALADFAVATLVLFGLMAFFGVVPSWRLLAVPLLLVALLLCSVGVGTLLSALTARFRDFRYLTTFGIQLLMYASPVVYPPSLVPEHLRWVLFLNPMAGIIDGFRSAFLDRPFDPLAIGMATGLSVVLFAVGILVFVRLERRLADII